MSHARRFEIGIPHTRGPRALGLRLALALLRWQETSSQRRRLLSLDDRMLKDVGITRAEALQEGTRPFWDMPDIDRPRWT